MINWKTRFTLMIALVAMLIGGCTESTTNCAKFDDWEMISENELSEVCIYQQIYLFKDEFYAVCECCVCDKNPMAFNCQGDSVNMKKTV